MPGTIQVKIAPHLIQDLAEIKKLAAQKLKLKTLDIKGLRVIKKSLDARTPNIHFLLTIEVSTVETILPHPPFQPEWKNVKQAPPVLIVGLGPAGLFAALRLIELGLKPILIERGKNVRDRRRDLAIMNKAGLVNPNSNYCFGEGGAGTYSDGKLYTRSNKRGDVNRILNLFVHFGADEEIKIEAHPHIGTNKLPKIISAMTQQIIDCGGEVHFETSFKKLMLKGDSVCGIETDQGNMVASYVILATGHSARDVYQSLHNQNILLEQKPFALGVRIEHPQEVINQIQYHALSPKSKTHALLPFLPPASYSLVRQIDGRGVFSFCMCPGGIIAPSGTAEGEIVVNGWSPSKRNNPFANSGTVVSVDENDYRQFGYSGPLAGVNFQSMVEQKAFLAGGGKLVAPAQRMTDFVQNKVSTTLPDCSYLPGVASADLSEVLPQTIYRCLQKALPIFGKKMKGYYSSEALLVATESRTSSPVRIPRDKITLEHVQVKGLYPCAEGAGYAGGIMSAAIDGEKCAEAIHLSKH